ncbi:hypothetical protein ZWY2020_005213 [Hordeum vulgare]|nr:hypothetical protein ZWY2020_005213 [Hordeum vulgare]
MPPRCMLSLHQQRLRSRRSVLASPRPSLTTSATVSDPSSSSPPAAPWLTEACASFHSRRPLLHPPSGWPIPVLPCLWPPLPLHVAPSTTRATGAAPHFLVLYHGWKGSGGADNSSGGRMAPTSGPGRAVPVADKGDTPHLSTRPSGGQESRYKTKWGVRG